MLRNLILFSLLLLPVFLLHGSGRRSFVSAEDPIDAAEEDEDDVQVDMEDTAATTGSEASVTDEDEDEGDKEKLLKPSPDADTFFLFTKPSGASLELAAGKDVQFLVGFTNKGTKDFLVETMDASFRYPMDFSFFIQNFTAIAFNRLVKPKQQISLYYTFYTSDTFSSRPFGLTVNLKYKDADGLDYLDAVFNDTVNVIEMDEGLDGETFFLYVFLAACAVLLLVAGQQFLVSFGVSRKRSVTKPKIETGTQNANDVDYDWLPQAHLNDINKSPRRSPRESTRARRMKRGTGSSDE